MDFSFCYNKQNRFLLELKRVRDLTERGQRRVWWVRVM